MCVCMCELVYAFRFPLLRIRKRLARNDAECNLLTHWLKDAEGGIHAVSNAKHQLVLLWCAVLQTQRCFTAKLLRDRRLMP